MKDILERFIKYVKVDTQSARDSKTYPSTERQLDLAQLLIEELREIGLEDVDQDEYGYVTATLPANAEADIPVIGFLAHMDTSPDAPASNVKPRIIRNYNGEDICLNEELSIFLSPDDFSDLKNYQGEDLVVTDGTTLLGADDKAGIAAIIQAVVYLLEHPEIPHGKIRIAFTPDEEVGSGVDYFDVAKFGADFAFTVDGGQLGEFEYENFNAAGAVVKVNGRSVHPGTSKGVMLNALQVAIEFHQLLPSCQRPEHTEKREGFIHLNEMNGRVEDARLEYIIRDHDETLFEQKKQLMQNAAEFINRRYGRDTVEVYIKDQYYNMRKMIEPHPEILKIARDAYLELGIEPKEIPVRGGTDGSRLSYMGLPTPNIFTGAHNAHGRFEYLVIRHMELASQVVAKIAELAAKS